MATINGLDFYNMVLSGLNNLHNFEHEVNKMNVFPVADGDTGTNMLLTIMGGYQYAEKDKHVGNYLKKFAKGTLLGARGNSGVILSQIFKGMSVYLSSRGIVNPKEMAHAFRSGYKMAYKAVLKPVEGTLLTVARLGIENIIEDVKGKMSMGEFFSLYLDELLEVVKTTPEYLSVLKDANVFDSGAFGYIKIIEGMERALNNEIVEPHDDDFINQLEASFLENNDVSSLYCVNFLLQLMHGEKYKKDFDLGTFSKDLEGFGKIINLFKEGSTIKAIIYTDRLDELLFYLHQYGEFASFNLENNEVQKDRFRPNKLPYKKLYIVAVSDSDVVDEKLRTYGADILVRGSKNRSPSTKEFVNIFQSIEAERIAIFPNDINFIETIRQAINMTGIKNTEILDSFDIMPCYYALMMDVPDDTAVNRIVSFKENINSIDFINIYQATKSLHNDTFYCEEGDIIATLNRELKVSSSSHLETLKLALEQIDNFVDKVGMFVFINKDEELFNEIERYLIDNYSDIEMEIVKGESTLTDIKIGVF